jgi:hypothetical protein
MGFGDDQFESESENVWVFESPPFMEIFTWLNAKGIKNYHEPNGNSLSLGA